MEMLKEWFFLSFEFSAMKPKKNIQVELNYVL